MDSSKDGGKKLVLDANSPVSVESNSSFEDPRSDEGEEESEDSSGSDESSSDTEGPDSDQVNGNKGKSFDETPDRDDSILEKVEAELSAHPMRMEEEILEGYGEAEEEDGEEQKEKLAEHNDIDQAHDSSIEIIGEIPTEPQKQDEANISDNNDSTVDAKDTSNKKNEDSSPAIQESDSKASQDIIVCDTDESKENIKDAIIEDLVEDTSITQSFQANESKSPVIDAHVSQTKEAPESSNNVEVISIKSDDTDMDKSIEEKFKETSEEIVVSNDQAQQKDFSIQSTTIEVTPSTPIEEYKNITTESPTNSNESGLVEEITVQETTANVTEAPKENISVEACSSSNEKNKSDNDANENPSNNAEISLSNEESLSKATLDCQAASESGEVNETANDQAAVEEIAVEGAATALADFESQLPKTVHILQSKVSGAKVYLVGTAHFSQESCEDVARVISLVQPDVVMLELCNQRTNILHLDESTILQESQNLTAQRSIEIIKEQGGLQGIMYVLLLSMSAHITKELGMAPGGEFRRAFQEGMRVPGCVITLGDRPIGLTLKRALAALSLWQKIRLGFNILTSNESITKEDVEKCKEKDLLENLLEEMAGEFPALSKVFVAERDVYLTHSLQVAADLTPLAGNRPPDASRKVVGVVGIGHMQGIIKHWGNVTYDEMKELTRVAPPSPVQRAATFLVKVTVLSGLCYAAYKVVKIPTKFIIARISA
eukprot:TRINITY_DN8299_c0_g2_i3.p1 TRINITY_DN8299_c0_g2~~TRINITY_DN8299_c0_g2_i3.p1  ORF type:complete len:719 (-),score=180.01 TRINITY_DN8299_c0_g2_i3:321-2477(-)